MRFKRVRDSVLEFKSVRNLSLISLFMSIWIVLDLFFVLEISPECYISFGFLVRALVGGMFGVFVGGIFGFFGDLLCYFVRQRGSFFLGYALTTMVDGVIYGLVLYKNRYVLKRIIFAQIIRDILCNIFLNTLFIVMHVGGDFFKILLFVRVPKNIIKMPINILLLYILTKIFSKLIRMRGL